MDVLNKLTSSWTREYHILASISLVPQRCRLLAEQELSLPGMLKAAKKKVDIYKPGTLVSQQAKYL